MLSRPGNGLSNPSDVAARSAFPGTYLGIPDATELSVSRAWARKGIPPAFYAMTRDSYLHSLFREGGCSSIGRGHAPVNHNLDEAPHWPFSPGKRPKSEIGKQSTMSRIFHRSYDGRHGIERRKQEPSSNSRARPPVRLNLSPPHPSRPVRRSLKERSHVLRGALPYHVHLMYSEMDRLYLHLFSWAPSSRDSMGSINFSSGARGKGVRLGIDSCILKWSLRDGPLNLHGTISLLCSYSGHSNQRTRSHAGGHASVSDYGMGGTSNSLSRT